MAFINFAIHGFEEGKEKKTTKRTLHNIQKQEGTIKNRKRRKERKKINVFLVLFS